MPAGEGQAGATDTDGPGAARAPGPGTAPPVPAAPAETATGGPRSPAPPGPGTAPPDRPASPAPSPADAAPFPAGEAPPPADAAPFPAGEAPPPAGGPPAPPSPSLGPRFRARNIVAGVVAVLVVAFMVGAAFVPLPYYLFKPGSVRDTQPLITVDGEPVYESDGSIAYTTVSLRQATLLGLARGWIDDDIDVYERDEVLQGRDVGENREVNLQLMSDSKQVATQVALERLGYDVQVAYGQGVQEVVGGSPADGVLEVGDVITAVDGEAFDDSEDLSRLMTDERPGDSVTVTVRSSRADPGRDLELALAADPDRPDRGVMGVGVVPLVIDYEFPIDVEIDTGDVGGPSAGLAFSLALMDDLTRGDLTGGNDVAVTGTIAADGTVGPVGGTGQKAAAVRDAGFDVFLVPRADYEAAVARAGDVEVVAVDNLDDALAALGDHGGNVDVLPEAGEMAAAPAS